jgi:DNA-binding LytR/AlgR family response regulator
MVRQIETARRELQDISVTYESDYNQRVIAQEQILYIKAAGDYTYLYRAYGEESELVTHSMKYWENLLTQGTFVRVHKSFLVNLRYIVKIENNMVVLENDKENIPVGRAYKKRAEEKIRSYILEIIRSRMR